MSKTIINSSDGTTLIFHDKELLEEYEAAHKKLIAVTYKKIRDKYGIWASNQDKFVPSQALLNGHDSKFMEAQHFEFYPANGEAK